MHVLLDSTSIATSSVVPAAGALPASRQRQIGEEGQHGRLQIEGGTGFVGTAGSCLVPAVDEDAGDAQGDGPQHSQGNADGQHHCQGSRACPVQGWQGCLDVTHTRPCCRHPVRRTWVRHRLVDRHTRVRCSCFLKTGENVMMCTHVQRYCCHPAGEDTEDGNA